MAETGVADKLTSGNIKLPGIGPVKKVYVYVGVGAVGVLAAYLMYRRQQAAADEVAYTDAELGEGLTTPGAGSDVYQGATGGGTAGSGNDDVQEAPRTNTEWTTRAVEYFNWVEPGYVTGVLGKYLSRVKLSREEGDFVRQVWAALGKPPEGPPTFDLTTDTSDPGTNPAPSVPAGLRVASATGNSIGLDWSDSTDATGYQVFRNGTQVATPTGSAYTDTGLASNTSYSYTVTATSGSKVSAASGAVTGKTTTTGGGGVTPLPGVKTVPGPISGRVTTPNKNSVRVTFKGAKNATSYEVWLDGKLSMNVAGSPFTVPRLKPDTSYTIGIRGKNSAGVGPMSNTTIRTKK